jgi:hypothetical protein
MTDEEERTLCGACAARLEGQRELCWLALLLTAAGVLALLRETAVSWWLAVVLLGLGERYVAARLAIDARLFEQLARCGPDLLRLDCALATLGMVPAAAGGRPLAARLQGALGWARRHSVLCLVQLLAAAAALGAR